MLNYRKIEKETDIYWMLGNPFNIENKHKI